jgi:hypothetical protein
VKLCSLPVDSAGTLDSDVLCVDGEEKGIVAVFEGRVAGERDCVDRVILLAVAAAEYFSYGGDVEGDVAAKLDGADGEGSGGDKNRSASVAVTRIDCGLKGCCVEGDAVSLCAVASYVVDASAEIHSGCRGFGRCC